MELSLTTTGLDCMRKAWSRTLRREESADAVVPDTLPDIREVIDCGGLLLARGKELEAGTLRLSATVNAHVLYCPEEQGQPCCFEVNLPVTVTAEDPAIDAQALCTAKLSLLSLDARVLNPRKVMLRAEVCAELSCYTREHVELSTGLAEEAASVHTLEKTAALAPTVAVREKTFVLSEEFPINAELPAAAQLFSTRVEVLPGEARPAGGKLVFRGTVRCSALYLSEEGNLAEARFETAYSQILDTDAPLEVVSAEMSLVPAAAYFELSGDGRVVEAELHILAQAVCSGSMEIRYLADAYSNTNPLKLVQREEKLCCSRREAILRDSLRELIDTPYPLEEIISAWASLGAGEFSSGVLRVPLGIGLVYRAADGALHGLHRKYELGFRASPEEGEKLESASGEITELGLTPMRTGAELRVQAEARACFSGECLIRYTGEAEIDTEEVLDVTACPSLVILRAGEGGDLWRLARENHSSVEAIAALNGLTGSGETTEEGEKRFLLIPKTR